MSQHDFDITTSDANTGAAMRAAINTALQSLASQNAGVTAPGTTYPHMIWVDTSTTPTKTIRIRNAANTGWLTVATVGDAGPWVAAGAATLLGFAPSQTPGANNIPVFNSNGHLSTPNGDVTFLDVDGGAASTLPQSYPPGYTTFEVSPVGLWPGSAYGQVFTIRHRSRVDQYFNPAGGANIYRRAANTDANTWGPWVTQWDSGNDGAGSGLDADTLDTLHASAFLQAASFPTFGSGSTSTNLPGGMIIKVGTLGTSGTYTAYPVAFPTATKLVIIQRGVGPGGAQSYGNALFVGAGHSTYPAPTAAGFYADLASAVSASQPATYLAIGY